MELSLVVERMRLKVDMSVENISVQNVGLNKLREWPQEFGNVINVDINLRLMHIGWFNEYLSLFKVWKGGYNKFKI